MKGEGIMRVACATDDGIHFISRHFGDAKYYLIYDLVDGEYVLSNKISNTSEEEKQHADPVKAKSIVSLLREQDVEVGVARVFGPNMVRIKKMITPVIVSVDDIGVGLEKLKEYNSEVEKAMLAKEHLVIK
jgi:predicted Fe-Mo cluster-binding NifX family protein